ncbi:MAG: hypothetical protein R3D86_04170 [Emcibacteraceae bacterium]
MRHIILIAGFIAFFCFPVPYSSAEKINNIKPMMLEDKNYTEYWEQYFYLNDGSLVTSQFLVANFPWPIGKEHGIMLGTLVTPEGKLYVIKNGRDRGEWGFDENALDIYIHTHRLKATENSYLVHLENTMAVVDLQLNSNLPTFDHKRFESEDGYIETSYYAPSLTGIGNWQLGPEAGFDPAGPVHNADFATGFGVHVLMTDKVDQFIKYWSRIIGVSKDGIKPFLSSITRPDTSEDIIFKLIEGDKVIDDFNDVKINYSDIVSEKDASYPKLITVSAKSSRGTLEGTFKYTKKFSHFNLNEHLNFFEKSFAKSNPVVSNFRYLVDYNLVYKTSEGEKVLSGNGLSEYMDILPPKKAPVKTRRRNRR